MIKPDGRGGEKNMTKLEAINELEKLDHCFLSPEGVKEIGKPFGFYKTRKVKDNRSEFKGLNAGPDYKEGDIVEGLDASELAELICEKEGVEYPFMHGRGSRLRACCKAMRNHLKS